MGKVWSRQLLQEDSTFSHGTIATVVHQVDSSIAPPRMERLERGARKRVPGLRPLIVKTESSLILASMASPSTSDESGSESESDSESRDVSEERESSAVPATNWSTSAAFSRPVEDPISRLCRRPTAPSSTLVPSTLHSGSYDAQTQRWHCTEKGCDFRREDTRLDAMQVEMHDHYLSHMACESLNLLAQVNEYGTYGTSALLRKLEGITEGQNP